MNILSKVNKNQEIYHFKFYGLGDYATNYDIQELLSNKDTIYEYYQAKDGSIKNLDDFVDFLFLRKYSSFSQIEDIISQEYKKEFEDIIAFITENLKKYKSNYVITFLQDKAIDLINESKYNIISNVFDLAFEYHSACQDILMYIAQNKLYLIINNFEDIKKIVLKYPNICLEILSEKHFDEIKNYMLKGYFKVLKYFINKKLYLTEIDKILKFISKYAEDIFNKINKDNALQFEIIYKEILEFLKDIKYNDYIKMEKNLPKLEEFMQEYLNTHGHEFSYEIPLQKLLEPFKKDNISLQEKVLALTHLRNKEGTLESYYTTVAKITHKSITEQLCSTSTPFDDYLTITKQQTLDLYDYTYLTCLQYFINKNRIKDFISILSALTKSVCVYYKLDFEELEFEIDYNILLNMYMELFSSYEVKNDFLVKGLSYSISMYIMALIEKLLRNLYIEKNIEIYVKNDWSSLGNLLNENNKTIVDLIGIDNVKIISYYLIKYNGKFGFNYRNNFAHYKNISTKDMNHHTVLKTTQILLCIVNELTLNIK